MLADGRLAGMQQLGGLGKALVFVDCNKNLQMSGFDGRLLSGCSGPGRWLLRCSEGYEDLEKYSVMKKIFLEKN